MTFNEYISDKKFCGEPITSDHNKVVYAMLEEVWTMGADWWILGADMWLADGQDHPVPDTWEQAMQDMGNSNGYPTVDVWDSPAWAIHDLLLEHDETGHGQDLVELLDKALYDGSFEGWQEALAAQKRHYGEDQTGA